MKRDNLRKVEVKDKSDRYSYIAYFHEWGSRYHHRSKQSETFAIVEQENGEITLVDMCENWVKFLD